jgi:hypothetical protein
LGTCNTSVDNGSNTFGGPTAPGYFRPLTWFCFNIIFEI